MMHIREAQEADIPAMLAIYNHAIRTSTATFDLQEQTLVQRQEWFAHYGGPHPLIVAILMIDFRGVASEKHW